MRSFLAPEPLDWAHPKRGNRIRCAQCLIPLSLVISFFSPFLAGQSVPAADSRPILTPKPSPSAKINGPTVYGARPGHPFLYRIPCTGERPIRFAAKGLPRLLHLDLRTGIITGQVPDKRGVYAITLLASNAKGSSSRIFRLVVGDTLALTPPMGWNTWYTRFGYSTAANVKQAADIMISSGMADFGYQYVDVDDGWTVMPGAKDPGMGGVARDSRGAILPNGRFQDMAAMAAYIHAKGLKAGLYTSPGPLDCAGFTGSYGHEEMDARTFAEWGFDLLKYDWCSYGRIAPQKPTISDYRKPYDLMGAILKKQDRDIFLNICQYGFGDAWTWAADAGGNSWRTTGDLGAARAADGLPAFYSIAFANEDHATYAGPGHWNDPDYLLIGAVGDTILKWSVAGKAIDWSVEPPKPTPTSLSANEQYSYMSLWVMMDAPLFFGGDMSQLDDFTLGILCNSEVIDIDQDALGWQARVVRHSSTDYILEKPLEDGSVAVGLFNLGEEPRSISVTLADLGLNGRWKVRDLWRQKPLGAVDQSLSAEVPDHGVALLRLVSAP